MFSTLLRRSKIGTQEDLRSGAGLATFEVRQPLDRTWRPLDRHLRRVLSRFANTFTSVGDDNTFTKTLGTKHV